MSLLPLTQDFTYWTIASVDGNSVPTWVAGVATKGRWVRKDGIVRGINGKDQKTEFVIYSVVLLPKRSMVILGNKEGASAPPDGSREVLLSIDNPSMSNLKKHVA